MWRDDLDYSEVAESPFDGMRLVIARVHEIGVEQILWQLDIPALLPGQSGNGFVGLGHIGVSDGRRQLRIVVKMQEISPNERLSAQRFCPINIDPIQQERRIAEPVVSIARRHQSTVCEQA